MIDSAHRTRQQEQTIKRTLLCLSLLASAPFAQAIGLESPKIALSNVAVEVRVVDAKPDDVIQLSVGDSTYSSVATTAGSADFTITLSGSGARSLSAADAGGSRATATLRVLPGWVSITPPLVAILVALVLRSVIPAMMLGIWLGATALRSFTPGGAFVGLLESFQVYVVRALSDPDHAAIILFSLMIGGMVGIITRNGGMAAIVLMIVSRAKTAVSGQVSVWLMGLMIFFDDYSNTLVVGNTARALTDHLKISREKLAYIVDSTAAPVVCLALITTWIGYEVGLIDASIRNIAGIDDAAYTIFLRSIPYSFYPILAVLFVLAVAASGRDMGPMYQAEVRARGGQVSPVTEFDLPAMHGDRLESKDGVDARPRNALVPIVALIASLVAGLYVTGTGESLTEIIGSADAYTAMLWASLLSAMVAAIMTVAQGILTTHETVDAWFGGVRAMLFAMIILVLAWALSNITQELHTADYLVSVLADTLRPALVPATVFIISALTAFTTGTSWGTMGILMPLVIPLAWAVMQQHGLTGPDDMHILYSAIACNLAGAVWGDHCSPISDTTVLSSMASGCDHIEHVRTQMPYAAIVGVVAVSLGTIPGGFGFPPLFSLLFGGAILIAVLGKFGKKAGDAG